MGKERPMAKRFFTDKGIFESVSDALFQGFKIATFDKADGSLKYPSPPPH
jgi:hypothetical protein